MNHIYLGIDGVLNNEELKKKLKRKGKANLINEKFDDKSMNLLFKLCKITNSSVTILHGTESNDITVKKACQKIKGEQIDIISTIETITSASDTLSDLLYLDSDSYDNFVIIDSEDKGYTSNVKTKDNFVLTRSGIDRKDGFTHKHFIKSLHILMGENYIYEEGI